MIFMLQWYFFINIVGFLFAAADKLLAKVQDHVRVHRISERSLLLLAAAGAFPGESLAFNIFHHKTRKQTFRHSYLFATFVHFMFFTFLVTTGWIRFFL